MSNIDEIMLLLDWNRSPSEQQQGILLSKDIQCLKAFFQPVGPKYGKSVWENCARVICERSDDELNPYLLDMLLWLEDLNWPGAEQIQQRLIQFQDVHMLALLIHDVVPALSLLKKDSWLAAISVLAKNTNLKNSIHNETLRILYDVASR